MGLVRVLGTRAKCSCSCSILCQLRQFDAGNGGDGYLWVMVGPIRIELSLAELPPGNFRVHVFSITVDVKATRARPPARHVSLEAHRMRSERVASSRRLENGGGQRS